MTEQELQIELGSQWQHVAPFIATIRKEGADALAAAAEGRASTDAAAKVASDAALAALQAELDTTKATSAAAKVAGDTALKAAQDATATAKAEAAQAKTDFAALEDRSKGLAVRAKTELQTLGAAFQTAMANLAAISAEANKTYAEREAAEQAAAKAKALADAEALVAKLKA